MRYIFVMDSAVSIDIKCNCSLGILLFRALTHKNGFVFYINLFLECSGTFNVESNQRHKVYIFF